MTPEQEAAAQAILATARARRRPTSRGLVVAAGAAAIACAIGLVLGLTRDARVATAQGHVEPTTRATIVLPDAAVIVVEPGAAVAWRGAVVTHTRGDVFYRVSLPLEITSPCGTIRADNACLRLAIGSADCTISVEQGRIRFADGVVDAGARVARPPTTPRPASRN